MIMSDGVLAVVLAAWWQLRRSANLLPGLRRGPSSFFFNPVSGPASGMMAIIAGQALLSDRLRRKLDGHVDPATGEIPPTVAVVERPHTSAAPSAMESSSMDSSRATEPIRVPAGLRPPRPLSRQGRFAPRSPRIAVEPPTEPLPVVGVPQNGHDTVPVELRGLPPRDQDRGADSDEPPTLPMLGRRGAA